ncbi:MAG: 30S ribosomal protein S8 [Candidatus Gracilibacteria bacterium]|nr:30S ribosomal protein S8 [Candidatus Gracilibacteria bacterium]
MHSDPIADYLTRIRNAQMANKAITVCPHSKLKEALSVVLQQEGYLKGFEVLTNEKGFKELKLSLDLEKKPMLKRVSKPGRRIYSKSKNVSQVLNGYGISVLSTSKGLMTGKEARKQKVGGEVICELY